MRSIEFDPACPTGRQHHTPELVRHQRVEDQRVTAGGLGDNGMHLFRRLHLCPPLDLRLRAGELDERRADHALGRPAGGIRDHEDSQHLPHLVSKLRRAGGGRTPSAWRSDKIPPSEDFWHQPHREQARPVHVGGGRCTRRPGSGDSCL